MKQKIFAVISLIIFSSIGFLQTIDILKHQDHEQERISMKSKYRQVINKIRFFMISIQTIKGKARIVKPTVKTIKGTARIIEPNKDIVLSAKQIKIKKHSKKNLKQILNSA